MTAIVSDADADKLTGPHVARCWFGEFDFPNGVKYLHSGTGSFRVGGHDYSGVSDPLSGRLVSIGQVEEPQFGQAAAVQILLSGVSREFVKSVHATARQLEGRDASISWAAFDGETQELITSLIPLFPRGKMSAPSIHWHGIGRRYVSLTIENVWAAQNFPPGGRWSPADQHRRFANDKGLDFVGVKISELWQ